MTKKKKKKKEEEEEEEEQKKKKIKKEEEKKKQMKKKKENCPITRTLRAIVTAAEIGKLCTLSLIELRKRLFEFRRLHDLVRRTRIAQPVENDFLYC